MPCCLVVTKGWNSWPRPPARAPARYPRRSPRHRRRRRAAWRSPARAWRCLVHGLDGVADQVEQHLLDLDAVGQHQIGASGRSRKRPGRRSPSRRPGRACSPPRSAWRRFSIAPLAFAAGHELAQAADDLAGAQRLVGGLVDRVAQHGRLLAVDPLQQAAGSP